MKKNRFFNYSKRLTSPKCILVLVFKSMLCVSTIAQANFKQENASDSVFSLSEEKTQNLVSAALNYRYTDKSTWKTLEEALPSIWTLACNLSEDELIKQQDLQKTLAIAAFHHIWQNRDLKHAEYLLNTLIELGKQPCYPFFLYLKAKLNFFKGNDREAFDYFLKASEQLQEPLSHEMRTVLIAIGSINLNDPEAIENDIMQAIIANDKGNLFVAQGHPKSALVEFESAFAIQVKAYGTQDHANVAYTLHCLGKALEEIGNFLEAEKKYKLALSIAEKVYGPKGHKEVVTILRYLGNILLKRHDPQGVKYIKAAIEVSREVNGENSPCTQSLERQLRDLNASS